MSPNRPRGQILRRFPEPSAKRPPWLKSRVLSLRHVLGSCAAPQPLRQIHHDLRLRRQVGANGQLLRRSADQSATGQPSRGSVVLLLRAAQGGAQRGRRPTIGLFGVDPIIRRTTQHARRNRTAHYDKISDQIRAHRLFSSAACRPSFSPAAAGAAAGARCSVLVVTLPAATCL